MKARVSTFPRYVWQRNFKRGEAIKNRQRRRDKDVGAGVPKSP